MITIALGASPMLRRTSTANLAPSVAVDAIAAPMYVGVSFTITGTVSDPDGTIASVTVAFDGFNLGAATVTGGTWSLTFTPTAGMISTANVVATATDDRGATATSTPVSATVRYWAPSDDSAHGALWLKADVGLTVDGDGHVHTTAWTDQFNGTNKASGVGEPTYSATAVNGKPGVLIDGSDDYVTADYAAAGFAGTNVPFTMGLIFSSTPSASVKALACFGYSSNSTNYAYVGFESTNKKLNLNRRGAATKSVTSSSAVYSTPPVVGTLLVDFDGSVVRAWLNGSAVTLGSTDWAAGAVSLNRFTLGASRLATVLAYEQCAIREAYLMTTALDAGLLAKHALYLASRA